MQEILKAKVEDVDGIKAIIDGFSQKHIMLPKTQEMLYTSIRDFYVVKNENKIIACGALKVYWKDLAEVYSLAVSQDFRGKGFGKKLLKYLLKDAKELGILNVFALSYEHEFFKSQGFNVVNKNVLPQKIWKDCCNCPKFPNCDETALIIKL